MNNSTSGNPQIIAILILSIVFIFTPPISSVPDECDGVKNMRGSMEWIHGTEDRRDEDRIESLGRIPYYEHLWAEGSPIEMSPRALESHFMRLKKKRFRASSYLEIANIFEKLGQYGLSAQYLRRAKNRFFSKT